jgi:imidazolonepropionase-like amidohydrolase
MKKYCFIILLFITQILSAQENYLIIKNVNIYTGEEYAKNINLVVNDGKILTINKNQMPYPNSTVIDGKGKTIIPPLINAHVHIWLPLNLKESLKFGIFANLDMSANDEHANQLRKYNDSLLYSNYYSANAGATVQGGHGTQFGPIATINDTVSSKEFVWGRIKAHADYIKILKEPSMPTLSSQQTLEIINETHKLNKIAVAHVSRLENALELTEQGVDGFVHIWWDKPVNDKQLQLIKEKNIFIIPTLSVTQKGIEVIRAKGLKRPVLSFENVLKEVKNTYDKGIPILCGTDSPNFLINYTDHFFEEMLLLSKAGLSNEDVLKSATTNVYKAFSLKNFGELQEGMPASFILINGNPFKDIKDIKNDKRVFKKGIEIPNAP